MEFLWGFGTAPTGKSNTSNQTGLTEEFAVCVLLALEDLAGEEKEWEAVADAVNNSETATCSLKVYGIETITLGCPG